MLNTGMPKILWTVEQAREMGKRSAAGRAERKAQAAAKLAATLAQAASSPAGGPSRTESPLAQELDRALAEKLALYRSTCDGKEAAALARSMRDTRELWHLVTGEPRPGLIKEQGKRRSGTQGPAQLGPLGPA